MSTDTFVILAVVFITFVWTNLRDRTSPPCSGCARSAVDVDARLDAHATAMRHMHELNRQMVRDLERVETSERRGGPYR